MLMARLILHIAVFLSLVSLQALLVQCQCIRDFTVEPRPGTTPLGCNVLEARITLTCIVDGTGVTLAWGFTTNSEEAGMSQHEIMQGDNRFSITGRVQVDATSTVLTIQEFDNTHNGFYWCVVTEVASGVGAGSPNPSRVLNLTAQHSTAELPPCEEVVEFALARTGERCAWGPQDSELAIIETVEFTNETLPTTTTEAPTTVTTETTTDEMTTTTEEETEKATEAGGSDDVVRTAIIWFSVGAAVLILLVIGVILCIVAMVKC